jgi:type IV pilus assembly protein PilM
MQAEQRELQGAFDALQLLDERLDELRGQSAQIESAVNTRSYWVRLLQELNNRFQGDELWLTLIEPVMNGKSLTSSLVASGSGNEDLAGEQADATGAVYELHLQGLYRQQDRAQEVVYDFVRGLASSEWFDTENITENMNKFVKAEAGVEGDRYAYKFDIRLPLKQHIEFKN